MRGIPNSHKPLEWHLDWLRLQEDFISLDHTEQKVIEQIATQFPQLGISISLKEDRLLFVDNPVQFEGLIKKHHIWSVYVFFSFNQLKQYSIKPDEFKELWTKIAHFKKMQKLDVVYMPQIDNHTSTDRNIRLQIFSQTPPVSINLDLIAGMPLKILHFYGPFKLEGNIAAIPTLEQFGIEVDPYGSFYEGLPRLPHLHTLYYSDVIIDSKPTIPFPYQFTSMHQLKTLVLTNVGLVSVPDCFDNFPNLSILGLRNNHLTTIPPSLLTNTHLKWEISGNLLARMPQFYPYELDIWPVRSLANLTLPDQLRYLEHPEWPPTLARLRNFWLSSREHQLYIERRIELSDVQRELPQLIKELEELYNEQWDDLYNRVLQHPDMPLTEWKIERITFEATVNERQWLENQLPPHHPLILAFSQQNSIPLRKSDYSILL